MGLPRRGAPRNDGIIKMKNKEFIESFVEANEQEGLRVFVAGGARSGNDEVYVEEAYKLGRQIVKLDFKLEFGLSSSGIMGAAARGVIDAWREKQKGEKIPISGVTTKEYYELYDKDADVIKDIETVIVASTLEERKNSLLKADFVVFTPGGVGTLDELAYDCVAMQDGFIDLKPIILLNVQGYFYHLVEYLKHMSAEGFADPIPFIIAQDAEELGLVFRLLKIRYNKAGDMKELYSRVRQLIYELPYVLKRKEDKTLYVEHVVKEMDDIVHNGTAEERQELAAEIEKAYLEKEIERMYERLAKTGKNTAVVSEKLEQLKARKKG